MSHWFRSRRAPSGAVLGLALAMVSASALAQRAPPGPPPSRAELKVLTPGGPALAPPSFKHPKVDPDFKAPRIPRDYVERLATLPDWTGSWVMTGGYLFDADNAWTPPNDDEAFETGPLEGSLVVNIPYKPEYQRQYEETIKKAIDGIVTDPVGGCQQPHGMPREIGGIPGGPEIIVLPDQVRMTFYWFNATRRIYTDGRAHPTGDALVPNYMGHSIGHWEGDTLVVDTVGMLPGVYDRTGAPHSGQVHVTERMRLVGPETLENQIVIEDPVMLTKPWHVTRFLRRSNHKPQAEGAYCEGGRLEMSGGAQRLILPDERPTAGKPPPANAAPSGGPLRF